MVRRLAIYALLAFYAGVALLGPELHELLGCEHHHFGDGATSVGAALSDGSSIVVQRGDDDDDEANCPVCKLLSMAQSSPQTAAPDWVALVSIGSVACPRDEVVAARHSCWQSRAPPSCGLA